MSRLSDGSRKVMQVSEIVGMEGDIITMQDIFVYEREGIGADEKVLGHFRATGIRPRFSDRLKSLRHRPVVAAVHQPIAADGGRAGSSRW